MAIFLTWIILCALLPGMISAFIFSATGKEDGEFLAFAVGFLLSYFGVLIVLIIALASSGGKESYASANEIEYVYNSRPCPYCAEKIKIDAVKCRFCNENVPKGERLEHNQDDWENRKEEW